MSCCYLLSVFINYNIFTITLVMVHTYIQIQTSVLLFKMINNRNNLEIDTIRLKRYLDFQKWIMKAKHCINWITRQIKFDDKSEYTNNTFSWIYGALQLFHLTFTPNRCSIQVLIFNIKFGRVCYSQSSLCRFVFTGKYQFMYFWVIENTPSLLW